MSALKAAEDLKNLVNKFKGVIEAGEYLQSLGDLNQAEQEAKNARDGARKEAAEAREILSELQAQIKSADISVAAAREKAVLVIEDADVKAAAIVAAANSQASVIQQDALRRRDEIVREGRGHGATLEKLQKQVEEETKKLQEVLAEIDNAKKRISSL